MLEANTDRSYFTIGAVIIGAIAIAAASFIFKDVLFSDGGYIHQLITGAFEKANGLVGNIDG
ncbi:hypothetical protein HXA34_20610 [Salipaludibacillus agaradhaerens]|jgi:hypothetical protein|uniref:hypothetical protein n=1 Tax=Salipaludibacillus agaradhaerens TaxID=76935 RepID=UPI0021518F7B|nr:hypothetical protein [Salipaludibacillus agaradhaerens]MCR6108702.1 hypothetical protein [Salipaludibacillus agaradhaerens]MCR6120725.1 hypothetical protein [Salipaludibacillus agaradhaerens]